MKILLSSCILESIIRYIDPLPHRPSAPPVPLMKGIDTKALLADKGYDTDDLITWLKEKVIGVVIPSKANRNEPWKCDWWLYKRASWCGITL